MYEIIAYGLSYLLSISLLDNQTTHERSHPSAQCDKSFPRSSSLKEQDWTNTGEKPFKCSKCDKSFSIAGHLKKHERTHTGEKPFKCKKCARASQFWVAWNFQVGNPWEDPLRRYSIQVHKVWQDSLMRHETTQERRHSSAQSLTVYF